MYRECRQKEVQQLPMLLERMFTPRVQSSLCSSNPLASHSLFLSVVVLSLRGVKEKNLVGVVVPLLLICRVRRLVPSCLG